MRATQAPQADQRGEEKRKRGGQRHRRWRRAILGEQRNVVAIPRPAGDEHILSEPRDERPFRQAAERAEYTALHVDDLEVLVRLEGKQRLLRQRQSGGIYPEVAPDAEAAVMARIYPAKRQPSVVVLDLSVTLR